MEVSNMGRIGTVRKKGCWTILYHPDKDTSNQKLDRRRDAERL